MNASAKISSGVCGLYVAFNVIIVVNNENITVIRMDVEMCQNGYHERSLAKE